MTVLVAGATGTTGSAVVSALVAAGVPVRALSRSAERAAGLTRPGVEGVAADPADPDSLRAAFAGVDAGYVATTSDPGMPAAEAAFARAAADAGAHLVKLSVIGAAADAPLRFAQLHAESEAAIEAAGGSWTFLQPNGFMQNDLAWADQLPGGSIAGAVMDAPWSIIDARDIAAVAVAVLTDPTAYRGHRLVLTGPQARTPRDRVAALAAVLGRDIAVVDVPVPAFREQLVGFGVPEWYADGLAELFTLYATGAAADVSPVVEKVLGRPATPWETFAQDHAAHFRG